MKRVYSVFSFLMIVVFLNGQYDPKENFYDAEFFFAEEDYSEALYAFTQVYNDGFQDNSNINYRIGICMLQLEDKKNGAIPYLEKAILNITQKYKEGSFKETNAPSDAYLYLGNAYRINNNFDKAIVNYKKFLEYVGSEGSQVTYTNLQIEACKSASEAMKADACYTVGDLGQLNQIRVPIYNPAISGDMNTFAFMGRQKFYNGIYVSKFLEGKWTKPYNITPSIQSDGNQHVLSVSHDGTKILLAWDDEFESDIWMTEYKNGRWYKSAPVGKPVNSKYYESHACLTPDGKTIYFTSNRNESLGEMDIFRCTKDSEGNWGELSLLGTNVNTLLNEDNPFVSPDGKRLYFSSQGHTGLGGFDIYYCEIKNDGSLGEPVNLGYPLNTPDDDFTFMPNKIDYEGYLSFFSNGDEDQVNIYRFELVPESAAVLAMGSEIPYEVNEFCQYAPKEELADVTEDAVEEVVEEVAGEVAEELVEEVAEELVEEVAEEVPTEVTEEVVEEVAEEVPAEVKTESYRIKPVYFDFDSYALSASAIDKLNYTAATLDKFPNLKMEIIGHTDAVGTDAYNTALALRRANAVADYLVSKGISRARLIVSSKGESNPVAINRTADNHDAPKGRALNRRVQFKTSVPEGVMIEIEKVDVPDQLKIR